MYRSNTFEGLKDFAISEYELGTGEEIPSEPKMINTSNNLTKLGIMGALVLLLAAYVLKTYISEAMKDPKKKE